MTVNCNIVLCYSLRESIRRSRKLHVTVNCDVILFYSLQESIRRSRKLQVTVNWSVVLQHHLTESIRRSSELQVTVNCNVVLRQSSSLFWSGGRDRRRHAKRNRVAIIILFCVNDGRKSHFAGVLIFSSSRETMRYKQPMPRIKFSSESRFRALLLYHCRVSGRHQLLPICVYLGSVAHAHVLSYICYFACIAASCSCLYSRCNLSWYSIYCLSSLVFQIALYFKTAINDKYTTKLSFQISTVFPWTVCYELRGFL